MSVARLYFADVVETDAWWPWHRFRWTVKYDLPGVANLPPMYVVSGCSRTRERALWRAARHIDDILAEHRDRERRESEKVIYRPPVYGHGSEDSAPPTITGI